MACRTRSKLPLVDVPINRLEAELLAPDITADMYSSPTHQLHDPHWTQWLQGLVAPDNDGEVFGGFHGNIDGVEQVLFGFEHHFVSF